MYGRHDRTAEILERYALSLAQSAPRFAQDLPARCIRIVASMVRGSQQQQLDMTAAGHALAEDARGDHAGFVENQHVAVAKIVRQIVKQPMFDLAPAQDEQARGIARRRRCLRDQPLRKLEAVCGG